MLRFSHLESVSGMSSSLGCTWSASLTEASARSRRCRVVMHSRDGMRADGISEAFKRLLMVEVLPVASTP